MSNRVQIARNYLISLIATYDALEAERQRLLASAGRLTEIQAEKAELIADAQGALDKYNTLNGTSYTLQQVRNALDPVPPTPAP